MAAVTMVAAIQQFTENRLGTEGGRIRQAGPPLEVGRMALDFFERPRHRLAGELRVFRVACSFP